MKKYKITLHAPKFTINFDTNDLEVIKDVWMNKGNLTNHGDTKITFVDFSKFYCMDIEEIK